MADQDEVLSNALPDEGLADDAGIDVDTVIQNAAEKANLSVLNVKSILHVMTHTHTHVHPVTYVSLYAACTQGQESVVGDPA